MYALSIALVTALLSVSAFALPRPEQAIPKRAISGRAIRYESAAHLAAIKRGVEWHAAKRETGNSPTIYDGGWVLPVTIGGQQVYLNIDTGSSDIWTASTDLPPSQQAEIQTKFGNKLYNAHKSKTFKNMTKSIYALGYGDGSGSSGYVGTDNIDIGGATVNMPFGVSTKLVGSGGEPTSRDTDGPVGLGFGRWNSIRPTPQCTFMECLEPYVPKPIFATHFKRDDSGVVEFGQINSALYTGAFTDVPINNATGQWMANQVQFGAGGKVFATARTEIDLNFDTGTGSFCIPDAIQEAYMKQVPGAYVQNTNNWYYPCNQTLPSLSIIFQQATTTNKRHIDVPGWALAQGPATDGQPGGICDTYITSCNNGGANAGDVVYVSHYMVFDQSKPSLCLATSA